MQLKFSFFFSIASFIKNVASIKTKDKLN